MTAAGLDPSRIVERATVLAKVHGAKRKRAAAEMDVNMDEGMDGGSGEDGEGEWMDVDGEDSPKKRAKGVSGGVVPANRRAARTDRRYAGLRDEAVRLCDLSLGSLRLTKFIIICLAIRKSYQTAEFGATAPEHAREGRRRRSCHQDQDGWLALSYTFACC